MWHWTDYCEIYESDVKKKEIQAVSYTHLFKAVDLGNVCHRALELFSKKASEAGGWTVLPEEDVYKRQV